MSGKIAIVGAGPSGCFLAQALLKAEPELSVDLIDALPVPYGLVRYGVAADHQGTKAVTRQFARIFERQGARFFGNLSVRIEADAGADAGPGVTLDALREAYDVVVLAAGMSVDRRLGVPGDDLDGVFGAARITRALYEHPDAEPLPDLGPHPLIVGNGNVAIDLLRLLAKTPDELEGSDLGPGPSDWLAASGIETLTITGRSPAARAKFDPVMIKELAKLAGVSIRVVDAGEADDPDAAKRLDALALIDGHGEGQRLVTFRFGLTPAELLGEAGRVRGLRFTDPDGGEETIACTSVLTAIGFDCASDLPREDLIAGAADGEAGALAPGLYATGWFRRGPRGTIPENRADAQALAKRILADLDPDPSRQGAAVFDGVPGIVDYEGWCRIDAAETATPAQGRCRTKITTRASMARIASEGVTST